jgi:hypothetical protein
MTEADWLSCTDPGPMLEFVSRRASDRKLRLFAVACCRRVWHMLSDEQSRNYVEVAEKFADRLVGYEELKDQQRHAEFEHWLTGWGRNLNCPAWLLKAEWEIAMAVVQEHVNAEEVARAVAESLSWEEAAPRIAEKDYTAWQAVVRAAQVNERKLQLDYVRCVFGNPFRPIMVKASWLTKDVLRLARIVYDEQAFDRLPELAHALEEAGCESQVILAHCREQFSHVRGCWTVDSILEKV